MPTPSVNVPASTPSLARPAWVHPARSATAFWTPTLLIAALTLILVLLWPRGHRRPAARGMPEPGAAYVLVEGPMSGVLDLEKSFMHSSQEISGGSALLDDPESTSPRHLPAVEYVGAGLVGLWTPALPAASSNTVPDLAARPIAAPLPTGQRPLTNGVEVILSPGLQRCGFHFEVPPAAVTGAAAVARFHVETDAAGRVVHLLSEPCENPSSARLIEAAVNTGCAVRAGFGDVRVSWGK